MILGIDVSTFLEQQRIAHSTYTKDMSEDIIKRYTTMLFNNLYNNPSHEDLIVGVNRVLNMPMVREAMAFVGYRNIYSSWKEYCFYLCMKFRWSRVVAFLYFNE